MTLIGKSFSAVIFVLSVIFMVLALAVNASHRNWRDVVLEGVNGQPGLKDQIETKSRQNTQLRDSEDSIRKELVRERAARRTALAALQTQLDQLRSDLSSSEAQAQQLKSQNIELTQTDRTRAQELERLTSENSNLRSLVRSEQQERDNFFNEALALTDQMNKLRGFRQQLEERNEQLMAQVTRFTEVMDSKGIDVNAPLDGAPPERNGQILQIDRPTRLVLVSIGRDEGLQRGHFLEVTRNNRYVGKLQVHSTEPDHAVAKILPDYSEGILQEGDRVDTTLD